MHVQVIADTHAQVGPELLGIMTDVRRQIADVRAQLVCRHDPLSKLMRIHTHTQH